MSLHNATAVNRQDSPCVHTSIQQVPGVNVVMACPGCFKQTNKTLGCMKIINDGVK